MDGPEKRRQTSASVRRISRLAVEAILDKKGRDILILDVHEVSGMADIFILATADSDLQVRAITEAIRVKIKEEADERPWHVEGTDHHQWVLMDYVDLVVNIFLPAKREYYALDRLWGDAPREQVVDDGHVEDVQMLKEDAS